MRSQQLDPEGSVINQRHAHIVKLEIKHKDQQLKKRLFTSYKSLTCSRNSFSASSCVKSGFVARPCGSFSSFGLDSVQDAWETKYAC